MAQKRHGYRIMIEWVDSGGDHYYLQNCRTVTPPAETKNPIEVDTHDNATDYEETIPEAIIRTGEMQVECIADILDGSQFAASKALRNLFRSGEIVHFYLHIPNVAPPQGPHFEGYVIGSELGEFNTSDPTAVSFTIKQTGPMEIEEFSY